MRRSLLRSASTAASAMGRGGMSAPQHHCGVGRDGAGEAEREEHYGEAEGGVVAEVAGCEAVEGGTAHRVLLMPGAGRWAPALSRMFRRDGGRMRGRPEPYRRRLGMPERLRFACGLSICSPVTRCQ